MKFQQELVISVQVGSLKLDFYVYFLPIILTFEVVGIRIETIFLGLALTCFKGHHSCSCNFPLISLYVD